jgi:hypothetical protein
MTLLQLIASIDRSADHAPVLVILALVAVAFLLIRSRRRSRRGVQGHEGPDA